MQTDQLNPATRRKIALTVQTGRPSDRIKISQQAQQDVRKAYLESMRLRFKTEINRLGRGDMLDMLQRNQSVHALNESTAENLSFVLSYVYAWNWLQHHVHVDYQHEVLAVFGKGPQAFLMEMLLQSNSIAEFIHSYIRYWSGYQGGPQLQHRQYLELLKQTGDVETLCSTIKSVWDSLNLFQKTHKQNYRELAKQEKDRYADMLGDEDRERLALVDRLPDFEPLQEFSKLGIIPAMGCPQTCRHCMFIFRPLMKNTDDPAPLYRIIDKLTTSVLFTGGDLSNQLQYFYQAIATMQHVTTFAILLNGDFANSPQTTRQVLANMAAAVRRRAVSWPRATVILQISFDEFHQEVVVDREGKLAERIPVTKIANIVEAAPHFSDEIQLCLVHKQGHLNFSMELFQKGVFARLVKELGRRGYQVQILSTAPSRRLKRNPLQPGNPAQLIKDAVFVLTQYPEARIMLTSSTIDAYGRASSMGLHEAVNERDLLQQMLQGGGTDGETFDKDLMLWFNGWATLFSAVHICLGNVLKEGIDTIRKRQNKDPLSNALHHFDLRLLDYYRELHDDLDDIIDRSTGPHHLFHTITEDAAMRLHMTRRLLEGE